MHGLTNQHISGKVKQGARFGLKVWPWGLLSAVAVLRHLHPRLGCGRIEASRSRIGNVCSGLFFELHAVVGSPPLRRAVGECEGGRRGGKADCGIVISSPPPPPPLSSRRGGKGERGQIVRL